jgi:hypothetical protein
MKKYLLFTVFFMNLISLNQGIACAKPTDILSVIQSSSPGHCDEVITEEEQQDQLKRSLDAVGLKDGSCPICMRDFLVGDKLAKFGCKCNYAFCPPCAKDWMKRNQTCPMCNLEVTSKLNQVELMNFNSSQSSKDKQD